MTDEEEKEYGAILIDTSIFDGNGLRLEKGLLGKLSQFKQSPIVYLFPDVCSGQVNPDTFLPLIEQNEPAALTRQNLFAQ